MRAYARSGLHSIAVVNCSGDELKREAIRAQLLQAFEDELQHSHADDSERPRIHFVHEQPEASVWRQVERIIGAESRTGH